MTQSFLAKTSLLAQRKANLNIFSANTKVHRLSLLLLRPLVEELYFYIAQENVG